MFRIDLGPVWAGAVKTREGLVFKLTRSLPYTNGMNREFQAFYNFVALMENLCSE